MSSSHQRKIHQSENGDSWWLCQGRSDVFVLYEANEASGGHVTRVELAQMLGIGTNAPAKQALLKMIGGLVQCEL